MARERKREMRKIFSLSEAEANLSKFEARLASMKAEHGKTKLEFARSIADGSEMSAGEKKALEAQLFFETAPGF